MEERALGAWWVARLTRRRAPLRGAAVTSQRRASVRATLAARAVALALVTLALASCGARTERAICDHCYCEPWGQRDALHPISCTTLERNADCCLDESA